LQSFGITPCVHDNTDCVFASAKVRIFATSAKNNETRTPFRSIETAEEKIIPPKEFHQTAFRKMLCKCAEYVSFSCKKIRQGFLIEIPASFFVFALLFA